MKGEREREREVRKVRRLDIINRVSLFRGRTENSIKICLKFELVKSRVCLRVRN